MSDLILSPGQVSAFDEIMFWLQETSVGHFVLAGYAGTGKSTLASTIADRVGSSNVAYCAYTGKAANVLREKGCASVNTIHGWLYDIKAHSEAVLYKLGQALDDAIIDGDNEEVKRLRIEINAKKEEFKKPSFKLNEASLLKDYDLVIVDEYSMLPKPIVDDLLKVCKKVLFLGDPYQLPPVSGKCPLTPDAFLEEIHRQALESGIIRVSKAVREGKSIDFGKQGDDFNYVARSAVDADDFLKCDQLIVGKNATRISMNNWYRKKLGYNHQLPQAGEKLICLKNNHGIGLFNGMIGYARSFARNAGDYYYLEFEDFEAFGVHKDDCLGNETTYDHNNEMHRMLQRFTYGYAITCHKSQGSEFDNLMVINEPIGSGADRKRWLYTAVTRAKKKCTLINPTRR